MRENFHSKIKKINFFRSEKNKLFAILEILKSKIDVVLKAYKSLKQNILRKLNKKENFYKTKEDFIKSHSSEGKSIINLIYFIGISISTGPIKSLLTLNIKNVVSGLGGGSIDDRKSKYTPSQIKKSMSKSPLHEIKNSSHINENISSNLSRSQKPENTMIPIPSTEEENIYSDSQFAMNIFKASESKDLEKTKNILFELSDLVNTFSHKVVEQQQMTESSKYINLINFNSY